MHLVILLRSNAFSGALPLQYRVRLTVHVMASHGMGTEEKETKERHYQTLDTARIQNQIKFVSKLHDLKVAKV